MQRVEHTISRVTLAGGLQEGDGFAFWTVLDNG